MPKHFTELCQKGAPVHPLIHDAILYTGSHIIEEDGFAPFRWACRNGHYEIVKYLCEVMDAETRERAIESTQNYGLRFAAENGHADIVFLLLQYDADPYVNHMAPLKKALTYGHKDVVWHLLPYCSKSDMHAYFWSKKELLVAWQRLRTAVNRIQEAYLFYVDWVRV